MVVGWQQDDATKRATPVAHQPKHNNAGEHKWNTCGDELARTWRGAMTLGYNGKERSGVARIWRSTALGTGNVGVLVGLRIGFWLPCWIQWWCGWPGCGDGVALRTGIKGSGLLHRVPSGFLIFLKPHMYCTPPAPRLHNKETSA